MSEHLLSVRDLRVRFADVEALKGVSLDLDEGETLGLVGESGSGKSTLARAILRLVPVAAGELTWRGEDLLAFAGAPLRRRRRELQIVFQDPLASLNPRMTVGETLAEPLRIFEPRQPAAVRRRQVDEMLERVGLSADMAARHPHEFSGGQCQRIGIARAMMLRPKLLVCDEPVSSLDVSVQGQIVNLLGDLQREFGLSMLFISHNLAVVRHVSHRVAVLFRGRMVEVADRDTLFARPAHPYTRALLAAVPDGRPPDARRPDGQRADGRRAWTAAEPSLAPETVAPFGSGCPYRDRCAYAAPACLESVPALAAIAPGQRAACHRWREVVYS